MIRRSLELMAVSLILSFVGSSLLAAEVFVSQAGSDENPGTERKPFATLVRARDEVRRLKQGRDLSTPITVTVAGGTYEVTETLVLGSEDSGTSDAVVTWQAAAGEDVKMSGGISLPSDLFTETTQPNRSRIASEAQDNVMQFDLRAVGMAMSPKYADKFRGVPAVPELFFNDHRMTVARWPNEGWATIAQIIETGAVPRTGDASNRPGKFQYSGDRPARWDVEAGVWLIGYWCFDWYEETIRVGSIDAGTRQITLACPTLYGVRQGNPSPRRFRAINLLEELDQAGEYFIDWKQGKLFFWPPVEIAGARIVLSALKAPVLKLADASHIAIEGFTFEAGLTNGVEVIDGHDNIIRNCCVRNTRQLGIRVDGGLRHRVEACEIHDTGTGGLRLAGGERKTLTPAHHSAVDNHIWQFSQHQYCYASGLQIAGVGNRAAHNHLHDAPHQAVDIHGNDHLFEYNLVHDVCTASDDASGLYKGRDPSCRGNVIRYNFWRDIGSPMGHGTAAVYFDDGDGGETVFGNIFLRCGYPGKGSFGTVFSHGGHGNVAENNIFVECERPLGSAPWNFKRWQSSLLADDWQDKLLKKVDITKPPFTTRYPELVGFMNPSSDTPRVNRAHNNVLVRCKNVSSGNWEYAADAMWQTDADPGFVDAAHGDYRLRSESPVYKQLPSFEPIPFDKIGPHSKTPSANTD